MKKHKKFPSPIERYREESKVSENSFACDCVDDFFFRDGSFGYTTCNNSDD